MSNETNLNDVANAMHHSEQQQETAYTNFAVQDNLNPETLQNASQAMHHSQKMQESVYNSQTIMDRIQPIYDLNERMHNKFFGSPTED